MALKKHFYCLMIGISLFFFCGCDFEFNNHGMVNDTSSSSDTDTDTDTDTGASVSDCDGGRLDESTGLCWQHPKASDSYEWQLTIDYCDGLSLAGHTDWYLPSLQDSIDLLGGCDSAVLSEGSGY